MSAEYIPSITLELTRTLNELPETHSCYACGKPAPRALIEYEQEYANKNGEVTLIIGEIPGWECEDGVGMIDLTASREALEKTLFIVQSAGDIETIAQIANSLEALIEHQKFFPPRVTSEVE